MVGPSACASAAASARPRNPAVNFLIFIKSNVPLLKGSLKKEDSTHFSGAQVEWMVMMTVILYFPMMRILRWISVTAKFAFLLAQKEVFC